MSTNLVEAIRRRRLDIVRSAVAAGASPDQPETNGPLTAAARLGYVEGVTTLLALGAKPTTAALQAAVWSDAEWHEAGEAQASALKCVELLLKAGASPRGVLPDHLSYRGWSEKADLLIAAGADPNERNMINSTAKRGDLTAIRKLAKAGANLNGDGTRWGFPLDMALNAGDEEAAELLVSLGASVEARDDGDGATALHRMCCDKEDAAVAVLLGMGADISAVNGRGQTPLDVAMENECVPIVRRLAKAGAPLDVTDKDGLSPLQRVVKSGHEELVRVLIDAGAALDVKDKDGLSPLQRAVERGHAELVRELIGGGADPNFAPTGGSALQRAASGVNLEVVRVLIEGGADPNRGTENGITPLMTVCSMSRPKADTAAEGQKMLAALLDAGADPNRTDVEGNTALHHCATAYGKSAARHRPELASVAAFLLDRGADPDALNNAGKTPYKSVYRNGRSEIVERVPQLRGQRPKECCSVM